MLNCFLFDFVHKYPVTVLGDFFFPSYRYVNLKLTKTNFCKQATKKNLI
jgi:hypothetical protein